MEVQLVDAHPPVARTARDEAAIERLTTDSLYIITTRRDAFAVFRLKQHIQYGGTHNGYLE